MAPGKRASRPPVPAPRRRLPPLLIVAAAAAVVIAGALAYTVARRAADGIAPPPRGERQPDAIRRHLDDRYSAVRESGGAAGAMGDYCLALHADMFYALAEQCYGRVIDLDGAAWRWLYYRALIRADLGGGDDLRLDLRAVTDRAPGFAPAWLRLGDAEFKAGRYDEADRAWTAAGQTGEPDRPASTIRRVVEVPARAYAGLGRARVRLVGADAEGARALVAPLIRDHPSFSAAHRLLAEIYHRLGRAADAERALARAGRLPPFAPYADPMVDALALESRNSTFLLRLASEADLAVNATWAEYLTRRALEVDPDNPEVVVKLGRVLRHTGRNDEALDVFRRYERMVPADPQVAPHIGSTLSALGRFSEAEPYLRRAVRDFDDGLSHYNLGLLFASTGRLDDAIAEYRLALERDPGDVAARGNLAATLVRKGEARQAIAELERLLALDPENAAAHANLGVVLAQRGELARARRALSEALRLNPGLAQAAEALRALGG